MLHEIIFLLSGKPGNLFQLRSDKIKLKEDIPFFHPHEIVVIDQLCKIAADYIKLFNFVTENDQDGLYISAFKVGLNQYLSRYSTLLCELEEDILTAPKTTLSFIKHRVLYPFSLVFPDLVQLCQSVSKGNGGVEILQALHEATLKGKLDLRDAVERIQFHCHKVLYSQMSSFMLHGLLVDLWDEFFIKKFEAKSDAITVESNDQREKVSRSGSADLETVAVNPVPSEDLDDRLRLQCTFEIIHSRLPAYILPHVAEKIRFVGESVRMFHQDADNKRRYQSFFEREVEFTQTLQKLADSDKFFIRDFEDIVENMRKHIAMELWSLIVEESNLPWAYEIIRNYFLLGNGQMMLLFIHLCKPILYLPVSTGTEYDVNCALLRAHATLNPMTLFDLKGTDVDNVKVVMDQLDDPVNKNKETKKGGTSSVNWTLLSLSYKPQWPLHFIFTPSILERCNKLFKFLLQIKLVEDELNLAWVNLLSMKQSNLSKYLHTFSLVRSSMTFLLQNFYYYLQVDVISSNYSKTLTKIQYSQDYESLIMENEKFLSLIMAQSFVEMPSVKNCIVNILEVCHLFHRLMEKLSGLKREEEMGNKEMEVFDKIIRNFNKHSSQLYKTLTNIMGYQPNPHLCQLLLRLDYNSFYSGCDGILLKLRLNNS